VDEQERRREAVRRRRVGQSPAEIAAVLGRSDRWVRKWVTRAEEDTAGQDWAGGRSRAPRRSPRRTSDEVRALVLDARDRLEANPRSQFGALAIAWELRRLGVDPLPGEWTINRIVAAAGRTRPRRRAPRYVAKGVPYGWASAVAAGECHQGDLVGPRHLEGGIRFSALNVIDVGSHTLGSHIVERAWPPGLAVGFVAIWSRIGLPARVQLDNHSNLRGAIPPLAAHFGPVVATCLDLGVVPRFIPLREPWRNGIVEHFNDTWERSFFRTARFSSLEELRAENAAFETFHNRHHRYRAHRGASPTEILTPGSRPTPEPGYRPPTRLPTKGRIEAVRFVRSASVVELWGHRIHVDPDHAYRYVLATIRVRAREVVIVTDDGQIIHHGPFPIARELR
jgi:putative transposase